MAREQTEYCSLSLVFFLPVYYVFRRRFRGGAGSEYLGPNCPGKQFADQTWQSCFWASDQDWLLRRCYWYVLMNDSFIRSLFVATYASIFHNVLWTSRRVLVCVSLSVNCFWSWWFFPSTYRKPSRLRLRVAQMDTRRRLRDTSDEQVENWHLRIKYSLLESHHDWMRLTTNMSLFNHATSSSW
jgi:hypothetical protein